MMCHGDNDLASLLSPAVFPVGGLGTNFFTFTWFVVRTIISRCCAFYVGGSFVSSRGPHACHVFDSSRYAFVPGVMVINGRRMAMAMADPISCIGVWV